MRFLIALSLFIISSSFSSLGAQTFTQKLTAKTAGTVTLHQDQRLTNNIDGVSTSQSNDDEPTATVAHTGTPKKMKGWRILMFRGDSSPKAKEEAYSAGKKVKTLFPELDYYVDFNNVARRCRVGDFRSKAKAQEFLEKIREAGLGKEAMIIQSEIYVYEQ